MRARLRTVGARVCPRGWTDALRQLALFGLAYLAYRLVRGEVYGRVASAFDHARAIISLERSVHAFIEPTIQAWTSSSRVLIDAASWLYVNSHFTITFAALVFLYRFRNGAFYFVRNMLLVSMALALVGYLVFPTAPPRLLPEWGFEDSVANFTGVSSDSVTVDALFNPFAAVPSMHVGFALMIGLSLSRLVRPRALRVLWAAYPALVCFVVIATGNHFLFDAVLGAVTAGISALLADSLARARPVWSWVPSGAGAPA